MGPKCTGIKHWEQKYANAKPDCGGWPNAKDKLEPNKNDASLWGKKPKKWDHGHTKCTNPYQPIANRQKFTQK